MKAEVIGAWSDANPGADCALCPRLADFRRDNRATYPDWFNAPVPSFGDPKATLLIAGLAPGLRGANRTGRPFTGDYAGELLYGTLTAFGFASGVYAAHPDDGLTLRRALISNAVRCVPPENKPTPAEAAACRPFLAAQIAALPALRAILVLGRIAHESVMRALGQRISQHRFAHGATHAINGVTVFDSYHCSRYNTNTGRLTKAMFESVFGAIKAYLDEAETALALSHATTSPAFLSGGKTG